MILAFNSHHSRLLVLTIAFLTSISLLSGKTLAQEPERPEVLLKTNQGEILIELNSEKAPKTVENFLQYVKSDFYNGTIFHRVIPGFMIQGGGLEKDLVEKSTKDPVVNEAGNGLSNKKYTIAMARMSDPNSATSQFFINVADNDNLDRSGANPGYTVFGRVVKGLEVVDKIAAVQTGSKPAGGSRPVLMRDVPLEPVVIEEAKVVESSR